MNSGLNPADPTLVAAFRTALLHQGAIALIILALVWLLWGTARTWRMSTPAAQQEQSTAPAVREAPGRPGLLDAGLADVPDALAEDGTGQALALLGNGGIQTAPTAAAARAGGWSPLASLGTLAASAPGRACGLAGVSAVSFGPNNVPMAAGSCVRRGVAGVFADVGGTWQAAGPPLPAGLGGDQVQVLGLTQTMLANTRGGNAALLRAGTSVLAAWSDGSRWTVSAPVAAGQVSAAGFGPGGSAWVLLGGGRAQAIAGPGGSWRARSWRAQSWRTQSWRTQPWRTLPGLPPGTATLAPGAGGYEALAASGSRLAVWQLSGAGWRQIQVMNVPITYGSSG